MGIQIEYKGYTITTKRIAKTGEIRKGSNDAIIHIVHYNAPKKTFSLAEFINTLDTLAARGETLTTLSFAMIDTNVIEQAKAYIDSL